MTRADLPDALADVVTAIRGDGRVYWYNELERPWGLKLPPSEYAYFHVVERGDMCIRLRGERAVRMVSSGDLVILPHGGGHVIADSPATAPQSLEGFIRLAAKGSFNIRSKTASRLICGKFQFDNTALNPLLPLLPPVLHLSSKGGKTDEWLESTLRLLAYEARTPRPGSKEIITRLTGVIFIQAMRCWLEDQPEAQGGWFGALRDPQIA